MIFPKIPENETERLDTLKAYKILDTLPEKDFDDIVRIASQICQTPISTITIVDENRQWFKAKNGIDGDGGRANYPFVLMRLYSPIVLLLSKMHDKTNVFQITR
jgi:hypothetical protein